MSDDPKIVPGEPWAMLRQLTPARVALGRTGTSLPTREILRFGEAHALARDAVHAALDDDRVRRDLGHLGPVIVSVTSAAPDRPTYLRRPDLGRRLAQSDQARLASLAGAGADLAVVVADGLSATAVHHHAAPLLNVLVPALRAQGWTFAPFVVATQARVALGDDIGAALAARLVVMVIGERPGLSAPDSLGAYLTWAPQVGRRDHERNCVSNIRSGGLSPDRAAYSILWLVTEAFRRGETGVALKDESQDTQSLSAVDPPPLPRHSV